MGASLKLRCCLTKIGFEHWGLNNEMEAWIWVQFSDLLFHWVTCSSHWLFWCPTSLHKKGQCCFYLGWRGLWDRSSLLVWARAAFSTMGSSSQIITTTCVTSTEQTDLSSSDALEFPDCHSVFFFRCEIFFCLVRTQTAFCLCPLAIWEEGGVWDKHGDVVLDFLKGLLVWVVKISSQFQKHPPQQGWYLWSTGRIAPVFVADGAPHAKDQAGKKLLWANTSKGFVNSTFWTVLANYSK